MRAPTVAVVAAGCALAMAPSPAMTETPTNKPTASPTKPAAKPATKPAAKKPAAKKPAAKPTKKPVARSTKKPVARSKARSRSKAKASSRGKAATKQRGQRKGKRGRALAANMPRGWSWPPTKAMIAAGQACTAQLDALGVTWEAAKNEDGGKIVTPITVPAMELGGLKVVAAWRRPPHVMDCHLALGIATYGPQLVAIGVREVRFSSIFRNTPVRVNGTTKNMLSRHALGLAIDVRAFVDSAGRVAEVQTDYHAADTMLLGVEQVVNDSGGWRTVLTPRNDPVSHYDHFHLEIRVDYDGAARSPPDSGPGPPATETAAASPGAPAP